MAVLSMLMSAFILMKVLAGTGNALATFSAVYSPINIEPSTCSNTSKKEPMLRCGMNSFRNYQPFRYVNGECQMCPGDQVTNLTFDSVTEFHFPTSQSIIARRVNTTLIIPLLRPLTPGTMIYLAVTPLGNKFHFDLSNSETIPYHLYITFSSGVFGMITMDQNDWGNAVTFSPIEPHFYKGQRTDIHFLLTTDRVVIYFDKVLFYEYMYRLPLTVTELYFAGESFVHELTL